MIVLDTNVLSEVMKRPEHRSPEVYRWLSRQEPQSLYITTLTVGEVWAGVEVRSEGRRKEDLRALAAHLFGARFAGRILPFDEAAARAYGVIIARRRRQGFGIAPIDVQILSIAQARGFAVATSDRDFGEGVVPIIDPWTVA